MRPILAHPDLPHDTTPPQPSPARFISFPSNPTQPTLARSDLTQTPPLKSHPWHRIPNQPSTPTRSISSLSLSQTTDPTAPHPSAPQPTTHHPTMAHSAPPMGSQSHPIAHHTTEAYSPHNPPQPFPSDPLIDWPTRRSNRLSVNQPVQGLVKSHPAGLPPAASPKFLKAVGSSVKVFPLYSPVCSTGHEK